jgi:hypothetical protein
MSTERRSSRTAGIELDDSTARANDGDEVKDSDAKRATGRETLEDLHATRAHKFVTSLMTAKYENILNGKGMKVLRNIMDLENGMVCSDLENGMDCSIVVRTITTYFWEECIKTVDTPNVRYRVAAMGTPGIGKTTSTPILIRILVERKKTVVYLIRTENNNGWYYECVPNKSDSSIAANVYRERLDEGEIFSLRDQLTYYIVDPGKTKNSCNPSNTFAPKVILVTSPDVRHWGESEFEKERDDVDGCFKIYPTWTLEELIIARNEFKGKLAVEVINERYRLFGGVPRNIFVSEKKLVKKLDKQNEAIQILSDKQVVVIAKGQMTVVGDFGEDAPKGVLMGFSSTETDFGTTSMNKFILSPAIAEKVYSMHIRILWNIMITSDQVIQRTLFEPYVRFLLTDKSKYNLCFDMKSLITQASEQRELQICKSIKLVLRLTEQALTPLVLYHSVIQNHPLIDCLYEDASGLINAIQITTGSKHSMDGEKIKDLHSAVGIEKTLHLYYFVPTDNYDAFKTKPVLPTYAHDNFRVYVVSVPDPTKT